MTTPFFDLLSQILSNQDTIQDLPTNKLIALHTFHPDQVQIFHQLVNPQYKLIMRLQTLLLLESEKLQLLKFSDTALAAEVTGSDIATTIVDELGTFRQTRLRCDMLDRLIAEAMHSFVPSECEYFDCSYRIKPNGHKAVSLFRVPTVQRFMSTL